MRGRARFAMLIACAAVLTSPVLASDGDPRHANAGGGDWSERIRAAREDVDAAYRRYEAAVVDYQHVRHRRRERGELKAEAIAELDAAKAAIPKAEARLLELEAAARRGGALPGELRSLEADHPPASDDER